MLVDDQADFAEGVRQLLVPRFEVRLAHSGVEALNRCEREGPFAVVVSDFAMPGMTGIELFTELRERWPDTARIMLTGCADLGLALEALEQGAIFRFLTKPPSPTRLAECVAAGVQRHHESACERALTEQLAFAQESLRSFNEILDERLEHELGRLVELEHHADELARAGSLEEVLERTTTALRALLGARAPEVVADERGVHVRPAAGELAAGEKRALAILESSSRLASEGLLRRRERESGRRATLAALVSLARHRDDETGAHLARVSEYCAMLARWLMPAHGVDELFVERIALAAPLHDIGKVAVPDSILFKPGRLDEREWVIMRTHAAVGADILKDALAEGEETGVLALAHELTWTHHERWDGAGYPRRLRGTDIPIAGRIMSVSDCYDALTSERPYKHAWTHAEAVAYLTEQRGGAFDPELIDLFLARQDEFEDVQRRARQTSPT